MKQKVIAMLEITESRPEQMRVVLKDGLFLVQTRRIPGAWITQKTHGNEADALKDCLTWY